MELQRRLMITGGVAAPAIVRLSSMMPISILTSRLLPARLAPAIVAASSLMPVSPVEQAMRYVARVQHMQGGATTIVGEASINDLRDLPSLLQNMSNRIPWGETLRAGDLVQIRVLSERESALSYL